MIYVGHILVLQVSFYDNSYLIRNYGKLQSCPLFGRTLKQMKYHMTTAHGPSPMCNTTTEEDPFYGPGQGATDGPPLWTNMCNAMINVFKPKARGCKIVDPTKSLAWERKCDAFVDDSHLLHSGDSMHASKEQIESNVKHDATTWAKFLWISGGALNMTKSFFALFHFTFARDGTPILNNAPNESTPIMTPTSPMPMLLKRADVRAPKRSLGMRMSGDSSQTSKPPNHDKPTEMEALAQKTKKFTRGTLTCPLKPHETMIACHQICLPSVCHSSACTTLSRQQWESIQSPLLCKLPPKLGLPRNFPRELVLGTKCHGGLGCLLYTSDAADE